MKRWISGPLMAMAAFSLVGCGGGGPKKVASVNGQAINEDEFNTRVRNIDAISLGNSAQSNGPNKAGEFAMQAMIYDQLIYQAAEKNKATPTETQMNQYIAMIRKYPHLNSNPLQSSDAELKENARKTLSIRNMMIGPMNFKPEQIQQTFDQKKDMIAKERLREEDSYRVRLAVFTTPAKAEAALATIKKGITFETMVKQQSEDPQSREKGGDIGMAPTSQMPPPLLAAVKDLKPNEFTQAVVKFEVPTSAQPGAPMTPRYLLAQMMEKKVARAITLEDARIFVEDILLAEKVQEAQTRVQKTIADIAKTADIKIEIKEYEPMIAKIKEALAAAANGPAGGPSPGGAGAPPGGPTGAPPTGAPPR